MVGEGWHARFGGPHAERVALERAGKKARNATLYVSLEPCAHHGKTPPCTEAIVHAGCRRVVYAVADPHPEAGGGAKRLRTAGIEVVHLPCEPALRLLAPFMKRVERGLPWVIAKWAMTLDGRIACPNGDARWITGERARARAHVLRAQVDAIVVGIGTALADDPALTVRLPAGATAPAGATGRAPVRVVVDTHARLPLASKLVRTAREVPLIVACGEGAPRERLHALEAAGVEVWELAQKPGGVCLRELLSRLARRGEPADPRRRADTRAPWPATRVLVEGGARIHGALFDARLIDEVYAFIAPRLIGAGPAPIDAAARARMSEALPLTDPHLEHLEPDLLLHGLLPFFCARGPKRG